MVVRNRFAEDIVVAAEAVRTVVVGAEAGHTVAVVAGIAAEAGAGCTAAFAAVAAPGCTDPGVSVEADCWIDRCFGLGCRRLVLPSAVGPTEHVGFLRGRV